MEEERVAALAGQGALDDAEDADADADADDTDAVPLCPAGAGGAAAPDDFDAGDTPGPLPPPGFTPTVLDAGDEGDEAPRPRTSRADLLFSDVTVTVGSSDVDDDTDDNDDGAANVTFEMTLDAEPA